MKEIKVVAFDCDGVMFDSVKANEAYYNDILAHLGKPSMTSDQLAYAHMHTADEALAYMFEDKESLQAAKEYRKQMSYLRFIKYMEMEPYLKPLLSKLRPKYKTAIATNRTDTMNRVLIEHKLQGWFDIVVCALDVERPKPHPDSLLRIVKFFNAEPQHVLYIGDSQVDELAATSAGVPLVAYKNPALTAAFYIDNLKELESILGG